MRSRAAIADPHNEAWLAAIWQEQAFDRHLLRSTSGVAFQVVYQGRCTGGPGPDFRDAILALPDGTLLRGDVEIHLEARGWEQHGHHKDPAYDGVLLHVVLEGGGGTRNSRGELVLTLALAGRLGTQRVRRSVVDAVEPPQLSYVLAPCRRALPRLGPTGAAALLQQQARQRFNSKQAVFEGDLSTADAEQVLYSGLLEALGYHRNRAPFRQLAELATLAAVRRLGSHELELLLLHLAGLRDSAQAEILKDRCGISGSPLAGESWTVVGVRPENLPMVRIAEMAKILARLAPLGLIDELLGELAAVQEVDRRVVRRMDSSWRSQLRELGPQRVRSVAINVLLPFAAAFGQATCQFRLTELAPEA
ncbi:MAG: DUF2851 family protein, partial [Chloroflexi bacterium]|nr:DUF2851 family protein [Chloroflexota bacterium]